MFSTWAGVKFGGAGDVRSEVAARAGGTWQVWGESRVPDPATYRRPTWRYRGQAHWACTLGGCAQSQPFPAVPRTHCYDLDKSPSGHPCPWGRAGPAPVRVQCVRDGPSGHHQWALQPPGDARCGPAGRGGVAHLSSAPGARAERPTHRPQPRRHDWIGRALALFASVCVCVCVAHAAAAVATWHAPRHGSSIWLLVRKPPPPALLRHPGS